MTRVRTERGWRRVETALVLGEWAVTQAMPGDGDPLWNPRNPWTVTHVPSGRRACVPVRKRDAVKLCKALAALGPLKCTPAALRSDRVSKVVFTKRDGQRAAAVVRAWLEDTL